MDRTRWRRVAAAAGLAVALLTGCSAPGTYSTILASPSPTPPAGTSRATAPATVDGCPNYHLTILTEPQLTDFSETGPVGLTQQRLQDDVAAIQRYGTEHPADFGSVRFVNGPTVRIVVAFRDHLAEHCAALRAQLAFPEEFEITFQSLNATDLSALQQTIQTTYESRLLWTGQASDHLDIGLRADAVDVARELHERYGDLITLHVGLLGYPDPGKPAGSRCPVRGPIATPPVRVTLTLDRTTVPSGGGFKGSVRITNDGASMISVDTGSPAEARVYLPGENEPVGTYAGAIGGVGMGGPLAPGASLDIDMVGATASCDPALGWALPPGTYEVRAVLEWNGDADGLKSILSDPVPLTIVP